MGEKIMGFAVGDKVKYSKMRDAAEIISGPHPSQGNDRYLIKKADGNVSLVKSSELSEVDKRAMAVLEAVHQALFFRPLADCTQFSKTKSTTVAASALAALDGVEKSRPLAPGDVVVILRDGLDDARVRRGDLLRVVSVGPRYFTTYADSSSFGTARWSFRMASEGSGWARA